ncbi:UPF0687 protein C20orf27 homolog isoform X2 [Denticeps clupeoides]|uniref:UPF0687 protein C20orf27 homolog isoform X2 n=1 Tax=Denticeps clupeoides TaxID=299321 RepID=UPI0010A40B6D|nr:UPF0687 protein C20orf27 homolog isoform X2 [Denticeps clupeoides]
MSAAQPGARIVASTSPRPAGRDDGTAEGWCLLASGCDRALRERQVRFCMQVGFLKSQHRYEIVFTIPQVPSLGKDNCLSPALRTTAKPRLRATNITPRPEGRSLLEPPLRKTNQGYLPCTGGVKVVCEYTAQQEGVVQEELTLVNRSRRDGSVRVKVQARVMDRHHGTPQLMEGVRCMGAEKEINTKQSDRKKM